VYQLNNNWKNYFKILFGILAFFFIIFLFDEGTIIEKLMWSIVATISLMFIVTPFYLFWVYTYNTKKAKERRGKNKEDLKNIKKNFNLKTLKALSGVTDYSKLDKKELLKLKIKVESQKKRNIIIIVAGFLMLFGTITMPFAFIVMVIGLFGYSSNNKKLENIEIELIDKK